MDPTKQLIVLPLLFLKGLGYKAARRELWQVLGERTSSLLQTKRWIRQFKDDDPLV
jgi:hypothetical protein